MDLDNETGTQAGFAEYTASLAVVLGHADRVGPFQDYCVGLLSAEERKSVEPLAAVTAPERTAAQHLSLLHFVAQAPWSDQAMLRRVREHVLPSITRAIVPGKRMGTSPGGLRRRCARPASWFAGAASLRALSERMAAAGTPRGEGRRFAVRPLGCTQP